MAEISVAGLYIRMVEAITEIVTSGGRTMVYSDQPQRLKERLADDLPGVCLEVRTNYVLVSVGPWEAGLQSG